MVRQTETPETGATGPAEERGLRLKARARALYHGASPAAVKFRFGVIILDLIIIAFFIAAPILQHSPIYYLIDYAIAVFLILDLTARFLAAPDLKAWQKRPLAWVDIIVLLTLLLPHILSNFGFLRVLRLWTLVESDFFWRTVGRRYDDTRYEELTKAAVRLLTFVFVITGFVYATFIGRYEGIGGWVDALYWTVTSLTTTGYGDVILPGVWGRLLSIAVMLGGVSLFIRLMQLLVRPNKVLHPCHHCGLQRHEPDASHCKACGNLLNIPNHED
jgi:voltage-gated potassium channel